MKAHRTEKTSLQEHQWVAPTQSVMTKHQLNKLLWAFESEQQQPTSRKDPRDRLREARDKLTPSGRKHSKGDKRTLHCPKCGHLQSNRGYKQHRRTCGKTAFVKWGTPKRRKTHQHGGERIGEASNPGPAKNPGPNPPSKAPCNADKGEKMKHHFFPCTDKECPLPGSHYHYVPKEKSGYARRAQENGAGGSDSGSKPSTRSWKYEWCKVQGCEDPHHHHIKDFTRGMAMARTSNCTVVSLPSPSPLSPLSSPSTSAVPPLVASSGEESDDEKEPECEDEKPKPLEVLDKAATIATWNRMRSMNDHVYDHTLTQAEWILYYRHYGEPPPFNHDLDEAGSEPPTEVSSDEEPSDYAPSGESSEEESSEESVVENLVTKTPRKGDEDKPSVDTTTKSVLIHYNSTKNKCYTRFWHGLWFKSFLPTKKIVVRQKASLCSMTAGSSSMVERYRLPFTDDIRVVDEPGEVNSKTDHLRYYDRVEWRDIYTTLLQSLLSNPSVIRHSDFSTNGDRL